MCCIAFLWCLLGLFGGALGVAGAYPVTLTWDANTEPDVAGYILRYGTSTGVYTQTLNVGNTTSLTISNLATETSVIYFVVSTYNTAGLEGPASLETNTNPGDTTLSGLVLSTGMLTPQLADGTNAYTVYVPFGTSSIVLTPKAQDGEATVTVNGVDVIPGSPSGSIMVGGSITTAITMAITAKDGTTIRTLTLSVTLINAAEKWRLSYFGSTANAGPGADSATPQMDGITNLMKFATGMNPTLPGKMPGVLTKGSTKLNFKYTRSLAAVNAGVVFTVERSDTLAPGSWTSSGVTETYVGNGDTQMVTATVSAGSSHRRFMRLVVTKMTPIESWRLNNFGSTANTGPAADSAIPQMDGITNLMKFATAMDPTQPGVSPANLVPGDNCILFSYTRNVAALEAGLIFTVEWSDTLAPGSWTSNGVTETFVGNEDIQSVTATVPCGPGHWRFARLVVTEP